jgi:hypothetical protein
VYLRIRTPPFILVSTTSKLHDQTNTTIEVIDTSLEVTAPHHPKILPVHKSRIFSMASRGSALANGGGAPNPAHNLNPPPAYSGAAPPGMSTSPHSYLELLFTMTQTTQTTRMMKMKDPKDPKMTLSPRDFPQSTSLSSARSSSLVTTTYLRSTQLPAPTKSHRVLLVRSEA